MLVLACGEMGESAVKDLYYYVKFKEITVATRSIEKVKRVVSTRGGKKVKVHEKEIDIRNVGELEDLMKGFDVSEWELSRGTIVYRWKRENRVSRTCGSLGRFSCRAS